MTDPNKTHHSELNEILKEGGDQVKRWLEDVKNSEKPKEWAAQATDFIQKNPWAAVAGAALAGYVIGHLTHRGRDKRS